MKNHQPKDSELIAVRAENVKALPARLCDSFAPPLDTAPLHPDGRQMAVLVARIDAPAGPIVALSFVLGDRQTTLTLNCGELDSFCHALADATLWQNEKLRQKAGGAVH
ncbi:hypothetical protein QQS45_00130 [Alteriqipengyuania flavescens]|uniref:hypothetical protein n=1 Tax=Alteriqipengyuania flavescens TaxID=3053610 RepID=UPI0025B5D12F|nr:hypothetical protein [Alteriqipengyuania flavescens]WJY18697.1 hypothetical protein QQW98_00130 [Alteriqipengyuania flavescens]WJY24637.1 hypothetical protein QQS45_00130 [Alteriqipengyuania flavescens]